MKKVLVTQVRSCIGRAPRVSKTLKALGLGGIGKKQEMVLNPAVQGMVKRVGHLLRITPV